MTNRNNWLEEDRKICKAIRKRVGEGTKLIEAYSSRIGSLISYGSPAAVAVLPMVDLVDSEGKLIDSSANLYRMKMREVMNE